MHATDTADKCFHLPVAPVKEYIFNFGATMAPDSRNSPVTKRQGAWVQNYRRKACMDCLAGHKQKMASTVNGVKAKAAKEDVILTEYDIPGAILPKETVEACSVGQLKRWLTCRGAKTTGKKSALVNR